MNALWIILLLIFLLPSRVIFGLDGLPPTNAANPSEKSTLCRVDSLPSEIQKRLKEEFGDWKVQEANDLSPHAFKRWKSEKPLACPGIAKGLYENAKTFSYAILLVSRDHSEAGYKFLVFSRKIGQSGYQLRVVEEWKGEGADNYFIHMTQVSKFFDEESKLKFHVKVPECILFVDSAENEYETDIFYWANGSYQHDPVDY